MTRVSVHGRWPLGRLPLVAVAWLLGGCDLAVAPPSPGGPGPGGPGGENCPGGATGGTCAPGQRILSCHMPNARDLGGTPVAPSGSVSCGGLFRGPPLAYLGTHGCEDVAQLGIRTVIDLRTEYERAANPDEACVQANTVLAPLPVPYDVSGASYLLDFDTTASITQVFRTLGDSAAYPIYFHCTYGRDRTGVVAAAVLLVLGASREEVMRDYNLSMTTVGAFPASLTVLLDEIERRGGIEAALTAAGVSAADLAGLRARMVGEPPLSIRKRYRLQ